MALSVARDAIRIALLVGCVGLALGLWAPWTPDDAVSAPVAGRSPPHERDVKRPAVEGRELPELRTARSRTWVKPDGMRVSRVFQQPVNFMGPDGRWRAIDNRLERDGAGWSNRANDLDIDIPARLGDAPVRVEHRGRWLELALRGRDVAGTFDGEAATFADVAPGVTARWSAHARQLKEDLILADRDATSSFTFDVALSEGLKLARQADGRIEAVGPNGGTAFVLAPPFAYDAAGVHSPEGAVAMRVEKSALGWVVQLDVSEWWLDAAERAYPVTVDPSVYPIPVSDSYIDAETTTTSYGTGPSIKIGHEGGSLHDHRGLFYFDVLEELPPAANVLAATMWAYATGQSGARTSALDAHRVTSAFSDNATWIRRRTTTAWGTAGGDFAGTPVATSAAPVVSAWTSWNLTDLVRDWMEGTYLDFGVLVKDAGSATVNAATFASGDAANEETWPVLEILYFPRTGQMDDYTLDTQQLSDRQTLSVNVAGGNLLLSSRDLEIAGTGIDLAIERAFNSGDDWTAQMGFGTRLSVGKDVELLECDDTGSMCFVGPSGYRMRFENLGGGAFEAPPGANAELVRNEDETYTMTFLRTGVRYEFFRSLNSFVTDFVDPNGNTIHFDYSSSRLIEIDDTQGREIEVTHNEAGDITKIEDPTGREWRYGYSGGRFLTSVTDPDENVTRYQFNEDDDIDLITDARGNEIHVDYDAEGRVETVTREVDGGAEDVVTRYAYSSATSPCGAGDVGKTVVTNPRAETTTYCWNAHGQVTSTTDALGGEVEQAFTDNRDTDEVVDFADTGSPATTDIEYNGDDMVTDILAPSGEEQSLVYWSAESNVRDPLRRYRVQRVTDANGVDEFYDYDDDGNLTSVKDDAETPRNQATLTYNGDGTLDTFTDGESNRTRFAYDEVGNLRQVTPPTVTIPNTLGSTEYTYDALSRVETTTDGRGETLTYTYDDLDRLVLVEAEDRSWISYRYDENGNVLERETSARAVTRFRYDKLNRMTEEDLPGSAFSQYGYDKNGNPTSIIDESGTVTYTYDDVDRVRTIVSPAPGGGTDTVTYTYTDPREGSAFTLRTAALPGSATQTVKQDLSGKVLDVLLQDSRRGTLQQRTYGYADGEDERTLVQTMLDQSGNTTRYDYANEVENVGRLLTARTEDNRRALATEWRYAYDKTGNRVTREKQTSGGTVRETYKYNAANQLCWRYVGSSANECGRAPEGATTFTYDEAGNQLTGENSLTWDRYGRLLTIGGTSLGHLSTTNDLLSAFGSETFQDNALGLSRHVNGETVTSVVRNPDTDEVVSQTTGATKRWYTADMIGSTIALTDDRGAQARSYAYDPDGVSTTSGSGIEAAVRFAGGHVVASTGLYHFGARYYDPRIGRWTSQDPLEQYADLRQANRYGYAGGDPVNLTDPNGRGIPIVVAVAVAVRVAAPVVVKHVVKTAPKVVKVAKPAAKVAVKQTVKATARVSCSYTATQLVQGKVSKETALAAGCPFVR